MKVLYATIVAKLLRKLALAILTGAENIEDWAGIGFGSYGGSDPE